MAWRVYLYRLQILAEQPRGARMTTGPDPGRCWRVWIFAVAAFAAAQVLFSAAANSQSQNWDWCTGRDNPTFDQRIDACTAIINSGSETPSDRAKAWGNRAVAYANNGNTERALRDYEESLRLD